MTRILLVEDNRGDARLFAEMLADVPGRPFALTTADTLAAALAALPGHEIVFLDLSLPDTHGLETLSKMLAVAGKTPIVVLTGNDDDRTAMEAVKLGAQDYLRKAELSPSLVARAAWYAIERKKAEEHAHRLAHLAEGAARAKLLSAVSEALTRTLDLDAMLRELAKVLVPALGDYVVVDLVREDGKIERVSVTAATPELQEQLDFVHEYAPGPRNPKSLALVAIRGKEPRLLEGEELLANMPDARGRAKLEAVGVHSLLTTPLVARGRVVGALSYAAIAKELRYTEDRRLLADLVAERVALGIDNASLYAAAQRAVHARDELLAVVSHDLRNPLGVLALALEMLEVEPGNRSPLPRAVRAVERMQRLIGDLLDVARIEQGTLRVELASVDIDALIDDAVEHHRVLARDRKIELVRGPRTDIGVSAVALADRHRLGQTLANLVDNALKFTPAGGTIQIGAVTEADHVVLSVTDTGAGIAPEHLPHIFDRFWQPRESASPRGTPANGVRKRDGVGLGLAIVKGIVDAHGGRIDVDSRPGSGTTFRIALRRPDPAAESLAATR